MIKTRINISDNIYEAIKEDILSGELKFGDKIVEQKYAEKLSVSRTPLREAIKKLEMEGIVERLPNGRVRVMEISIPKIKEIFKIRIALEEILFESIAENEEVIELLEENVNITKQYIDMENWSEARKLFLNFNILLYEKSNLNFTIRILKQYDLIISKLRRNSLKNFDRIKDACDEHLMIIKYLKSKQLDLAKTVNVHHLLNSEKSIIDSFDFQSE